MSIVPQSADKVTRQALCCECGNLRTVSENHSPRNYQPEGSSAEHIATMMRHAPNYWSKVQPFERLLEDLKCAPCGRVTRHAIVPDVARRDYAEEEDHQRTPLVSVEDTIALLEGLGAEIRMLLVRGGYASVARWIDTPSEWVVRVNRAAEDQAELASVLRKVLAHITHPDDHKWWVRTDSGRPYVTMEWIATWAADSEAAR